MEEKETKFDHSASNIYEACGVDRKTVLKHIIDLPDELDKTSELIELFCEAGNDPVKNLAIAIAYFIKEDK